MDNVSIVNFWCSDCAHDWSLRATKCWMNSLVEEVWMATCPDCHRRLTRLRDVHAGKDPYFRRSRYIKLQRRKYIDDLVQVGDSRFDMLYPQHKKEREAHLEFLERKNYGK